jgi:ferredoxin-NADP reductase
MAMIRSRAAAASTAPFRLLYSVRGPDTVWYGDEDCALSARDAYSAGQGGATPRTRGG